MRHAASAPSQTSNLQQLGNSVVEKVLELMSCPHNAVVESKRLAFDQSVQDLVVRVGGGRTRLRRQGLEVSGIRQVPNGWGRSDTEQDGSHY
jgi:hypothetical protein